MAEIRVARVEQGHTKIKNVPIAVTPEGFWCCPSPVVFQKTPKHQNPLNNKPPRPPSSSPPHSKTTTPHKMKQTDRKPSRSGVLTPDDSQPPPCLQSQTALPVAAAAAERPVRPPKPEHLPRKVSIEFGDTGTSDMKVLLFGKQGFSVKLSVHRNVLVERSSFFAQKIFEERDGSPCLEIDDCEDVEIYVETVGLMYCKDMKQRLIKQSVARVLRILKVAEILGFNECIQSCLEYLEAVPWVGEEEEEKVILSMLSLQGEGSSSSKCNIPGVSVSPVLNRVSSGIANPPPPNDTLYQIIEMVLKSNEERSRREMKSIVLNLLKETCVQMCPQTLDNCCRTCLNSLLSLFRKATDPESETTSGDSDRDKKKIALEADNISWLLEIQADRQGADEFAVIWAHQIELAALHAKLPALTRYHVSFITARLFVGIGRGQLLPLKETRVMLLNTWLQPLINDYRWLDHGCKSFDRKVVEEGIGRTILTLPLEDQQSMLLSWLASFLKAGDNNCPNLQRAFQVWWRRTFIRPYVEESHSTTSTATTTTTLLDTPAEKLDGIAV